MNKQDNDSLTKRHNSPPEQLISDAELEEFFSSTIHRLARKTRWRNIRFTGISVAAAVLIVVFASIYVDRIDHTGNTHSVAEFTLTMPDTIEQQLPGVTDKTIDRPNVSERNLIAESSLPVTPPPPRHTSNSEAYHEALITMQKIKKEMKNLNLGDFDDMMDNTSREYAGTLRDFSQGYDNSMLELRLLLTDAINLQETILDNKNKK